MLSIFNVIAQASVFGRHLDAFIQTEEPTATDKIKWFVVLALPTTCVCITKYCSEEVVTEHYLSKHKQNENRFFFVGKVIFSHIYSVVPYHYHKYLPIKFDDVISANIFIGARRSRIEKDKRIDD